MSPREAGYWANSAAFPFTTAWRTDRTSIRTTGQQIEFHAVDFPGTRFLLASWIEAFETRGVPLAARPPVEQALNIIKLSCYMGWICVELESFFF